MGLMSEFKEFLFEYKVIPLAIALIMGIASTAFINSRWSLADCNIWNWAYSSELGCFSRGIDKLHHHRICGFYNCKKVSKGRKSGTQIIKKRTRQY